MSRERQHPLRRLVSSTVVLLMVILAAVLTVDAVRTGVGQDTALTPSAAQVAADAGQGQQPEEPVYTFVSAPDLLNADIGDISTLRRWKPGMPNSTNAVDEESLRRLYADMASWAPDAYFVAGDEVRGHWDQDGSGLKIFGPTKTALDKRAAIERAADFYYPAWKQRFTANGIDVDTVYPALGDHEIGDNPWPAGSVSLGAVPLFKKLWAQHFTTVDGGPNRFPMHPEGTAYDETAYATYLAPKLLLVTVDTFAWSTDSLSIDVGSKQLDWLRGVLADAPRDATILVQGHVPVLTPVRTRGSSSLHLDNGADSAFWQLLDEYGVDLYLNGEVHNYTASQVADGHTVQLSHGGLFAHGSTNYVVGRVYADGSITLDARKMTDLASGADLEPRLWQSRNNLQWHVRFPETSTSVGSMSIDAGRHITERTGLLEPYDPPPGTVLQDTEDGLDAAGTTTR